MGLKVATQHCETLGLRAAGIQAHRLSLRLENPTVDVAEFRSGLADLWSRMKDDLESCWFLYVAKEDHYEQEELFGSRVRIRFPSAADDIQEAGSCFALRRWTATVHHCMGIMQAGLIALAKHLHRTVV
ncbi:MAG: hypothetical protein WA005_08365 [Candidatus Binataceae bacterium]